jgi:hypothetical protein
LLAELDATLKQFPTIKGTLYAFDGDVPAFYTWLQLGPLSMPTATWRATAPAPIAGRDGAAAVWTGRQLPVWGGHGRSGSQGLHPLCDGAAYYPAGDRWQSTPNAPAGVQGSSVAAAWTGTRMLVWDGPCDRRRPLRPGARPVEPDRTRSGRGRQPLRAGADRHPAGGLERHGDRRHRLRVGDQPLVDPAARAAGPEWPLGCGDGLDRPRGGPLERLEHRGSIAAVPRWAAYRSATST